LPKIPPTDDLDVKHGVLEAIMHPSVPAGFAPAPLYVPIQVLRSIGIPEVISMTITKQVLTISLWGD
jgi:hypothetical protein